METNPCADGGKRIGPFARRCETQNPRHRDLGPVRCRPERRFSCGEQPKTTTRKKTRQTPPLTEVPLAGINPCADGGERIGPFARRCKTQNSRRRDLGPVRCRPERRFSCCSGEHAQPTKTTKKTRQTPPQTEAPLAGIAPCADGGERIRGAGWVSDGQQRYIWVGLVHNPALWPLERQRPPKYGDLVPSTLLRIYGGHSS